MNTKQIILIILGVLLIAIGTWLTSNQKLSPEDTDSTTLGHESEKFFDDVIETLGELDATEPMREEQLWSRISSTTIMMKGFEITFPNEISYRGGLIDVLKVEKINRDIFAKIKLSPDEYPTDDISLTIHVNPKGLALDRWFIQNIDPAKILIGSTYLHSDNNHREILFLDGEVPESWSGGPLGKLIYVKLYGSDDVISLSLGQDHSLHMLGYDTQEKRQGLLLDISDNIELLN